jgi:UDP-3-O-[3-hydroxymyristoyl] glucosamine N-acyltransferase
MRNSNETEGFLVKDFSNQASHDHAATAKAVSDLYAFMRSSNDLLNTDFSNVDSQNSHSNAASTKALYDLYAYMRNSNNEGFLVKDFSNQDSHEHAATAKAVSDMFNYFTTGNMYISDDINDTDANKVVSASNFNKLYENLVLPTFFTDFNDFIFTSAYLKDINDEVTDSNPYSSEATSNLIQSMIGESSSIFNSLSTGNLIESSFNVDNSRKLASAKAVHDLSNNIYSALKTSNVSIGLIDRLSVTDSFLNVRSSENDNIELGLRFSTDDFSVKDSNTTGGETVKVLGLNQNSIDTQIGQVVTAIFQDTTQDIGLINRISTSQPFLNVSETQNANVTVGFNFDPDDFSVNTETNQFGINFANFDTNVATVAKNVIRVEVNTETGFAANVLDISSNNGVFKFQFNPSPLIDEITREATKATADAIFKYILEDYNFGCNVYFNKNIFIDSNINVSNDIHAGRDVFISNELSIHNSVYMKSNAHIALNLSVGNNAVVGGTLSLNKTAYMMSNVEISSTLEVQDDVHMRANMYVTDNAFISSNLSIGKDVFCSSNLSIGSNAYITSNLSIGSNAYITSNLSIGKDAYVANLKALSNVRIGKYLSVADDAIFSGNVVIGCNLSVESVNMNELNFKNVFSIDTINIGGSTTFENQPRITGKNVYDNNLIFSNINVVLSNDAMLEASNIIITGKATFDNVIDGFVSRITTKDKTMENSSKSYTPVLIDETDTDGVALRYCSNMTFKKNGDVIMTDNLSVGKEIRGSNLSVGSLYFTTLLNKIPAERIEGNLGVANNVNAHSLSNFETNFNIKSLALFDGDSDYESGSNTAKEVQYSKHLKYDNNSKILMATNIQGNGSGITNLHAANMSSGYIPEDRYNSNDILNIINDTTINNAKRALSADTVIMNGQITADDAILFINSDGNIRIPSSPSPTITYNNLGIKIGSTELNNTTLKVATIVATDIIYGDGSGITNINASALSAGKIHADRYNSTDIVNIINATTINNALSATSAYTVETDDDIVNDKYSILFKSSDADGNIKTSSDITYKNFGIKIGSTELNTTTLKVATIDATNIEGAGSGITTLHASNITDGIIHADRYNSTDIVNIINATTISVAKTAVSADTVETKGTVASGSRILFKHNSSGDIEISSDITYYNANDVEGNGIKIGSTVLTSSTLKVANINATNIAVGTVGTGATTNITVVAANSGSTIGTLTADNTIVNIFKAESDGSTLQIDGNAEAETGSHIGILTAGTSKLNKLSVSDTLRINGSVSASEGDLGNLSVTTSYLNDLSVSDTLRINGSVSASEGDLGNLSVTTSYLNDLSVSSDLRINSSVSATQGTLGNLSVATSYLNNLSVSSDLRIEGSVSASEGTLGNLSVATSYLNNLSVSSDLRINSSVSASEGTLGNLSVATSYLNNLSVSSDLRINSSVSASEGTLGNLSVATSYLNNLSVSSDLRIEGSVSASEGTLGNLSVATSYLNNLSVSSDLRIEGSVSASEGKLGNLSVATSYLNNLSVSSDLRINSSVSASEGTLGNLSVATSYLNNLSVSSDLRIEGSVSASEGDLGNLSVVKSYLNNLIVSDTFHVSNLTATDATVGTLNVYASSSGVTIDGNVNTGILKLAEKNISTDDTGNAGDFLFTADGFKGCLISGAGYEEIGGGGKTTVNETDVKDVYETGMFIKDGYSNIDFFTNSNGTPPDLQIQDEPKQINMNTVLNLGGKGENFADLNKIVNVQCRSEDNGINVLDFNFPSEGIFRITNATLEVQGGASSIDFTNYIKKPEYFTTLAAYITENSLKEEATKQYTTDALKDYIQKPSDYVGNTLEGYIRSIINAGTAVVWTAKDLQNDWINMGSGYNEFGYKKTNDGIVHLRGVIKRADDAFPSLFINLPTEYRPENTHIFLVVSGIEFQSEGRIKISPNGDIEYIKGIYAFVSLDGISFESAS